MRDVTIYQEDKARLKRARSRQAIALALESRWEEAVEVNRSILGVFPNDVEALNRLGKALSELGRYDEAREAYAKALSFAPQNSIAQKNLRRLDQLRETAVCLKEDKLSPKIFIEETGKTGVSKLVNPAPGNTLVKLSPGTPVSLRARGHVLTVESSAGEYLGQLEPRLALRLVKLVQGGNRYEAAIASLGPDGARVVIKEVYQHPSQAGLASFPAPLPDGFRAYMKETILKYDLEDELGDEEEEADWGEEKHLAEEVVLEPEESAPPEAEEGGLLGE